MTEIWTPASENDAFPSEALNRALELNPIDQLPSNCPDEILPLQPWMKRPFTQWQDTLETLDVAQLTHLVRFFTLAETQWTDWQAGDKNPAIWASKVLKQKQAFPDKTLIAWIRQVSTNRFIPYGNILG
ncbi:hypothetical protein QWZ13_13470 [Reinekea marina]|uniref:Uncharacterized protein n=1 Tax=Reinekea marina TaxID=1310421 RepID=A0ABV7WML6_9GAMM|nr:hypothetical protein [Reinekea marina]MDN3649924.1 hypothetical protein [Reinekea marina]